MSTEQGQHPTPSYWASPRFAANMAMVALGLSAATLLTCIVIWMHYIVTSPAKSSVQVPELKGDKNDYTKLNSLESAERLRQRTQTERHTAVSQGCAHLSGIALILLAVSLFLFALAGTGVSTEHWPATARNLAIFGAGTVALICASLVFIYWAPPSAPFAPTLPANFAPQAISFAPQ